MQQRQGRAVYIDCDVEEPNGRLFFQPGQVTSSQVSTLLPVFDAERCTGCKKCVQFCRFHALMYIKEKPMVFSEVCHSCGGCSLVCPENAITEKEKPVGSTGNRNSKKCSGSNRNFKSGRSFGNSDYSRGAEAGGRIYRFRLSSRQRLQL